MKPCGLKVQCGIERYHYTMTDIRQRFITIVTSKQTQL